MKKAFAVLVFLSMTYLMVKGVALAFRNRAEIEAGIR